MRVNVDRVYTGEEIIWGHHLAIWEVSLHDFDLNTLQYDLHTLNWEGNQPQGPLRLATGYPPPEKIELFKKEFALLKNDILEQVYETGSDYIKKNWYASIDVYKEKTIMGIQIYKDLPGFSMEPHIDNGHVMFQLLINLTENDLGTAFHNPSTYETASSISEPVYRATGQQGKGIIFVNNTNSAHSINYITKDRYMLYASIYIDF